MFQNNAPKTRSKYSDVWTFTVVFSPTPNITLHLPAVGFLVAYLQPFFAIFAVPFA